MFCFRKELKTTATGTMLISLRNMLKGKGLERDKGYAWLVLVMSFLSHIGHLGFNYAIVGNLTIQHKMLFGISLQESSLIGSVHLALFCVFGKWLLQKHLKYFVFLIRHCQALNFCRNWASLLNIVNTVAQHPLHWWLPWDYFECYWLIRRFALRRNLGGID